MRTNPRVVFGPSSALALGAIFSFFAAARSPSSQDAESAPIVFKIARSDPSRDAYPKAAVQRRPPRRNNKMPFSTH
jgi:hypothetical protein